MNNWASFRGDMMYGVEELGFVQEPSPATMSVNGGNSFLKSSVMSFSKSTAAKKSHKEAERRRRQRINDHLATLRSILPNKTKTDKASLLAEVVDHVKQLKKRYAEVARENDDDGGRGSELIGPLPSETEEVEVVLCGVESARVVICCEDRPGLNQDLNLAIKSVRATVVRAQMANIGGRSKYVVVIEWGGRNAGGGEDILPLKRALKAVAENRFSSYMMENQMFVNRLYGPGNYGNRAFRLLD